MQGYQKYNVFVLILSVLVLLSVGLLMLASTGAYATDGTAADMGALRHQAMYLVLGIVVAVVVSHIDYHVWEKLFPLVFFGTVVMLALCYVPNVGKEINGERRWVDFRVIGMGFIGLQPSELGKMTALMFMAWWYAKHPLKVQEFWKGFVLPWVGLAALILLVAFERDLGTAALMGLTCLLVMFMVGVRLVYLGLVAGVGVAGLIGAVRFIPERLDRWMAFLDLEKNRLGEGLQQWRAHIALGSGGLTGRGYGNGIEKMFYMPYAHTDFIFPMIGEEFGLAGTLFIIFCFIAFVISGMLTASSAPDGFGRTLGAGIIALISCQALVNMAVTTALLPNKGLPLPFISYGGSSLVVELFMLGILLNVHRQGIEHDRPVKCLLPGTTVITPRL